MSNAVTFLEHDNYFLITVDGHLTVESLSSSQVYLFSNQNYVSKPNIIWDFRKSKTDFAKINIKEIANNTIINRKTNVKAKVAIIVSDKLPWVKDGVNEFFNEMQNLPIDFSIFHTLDSAIFWVNGTCTDSPFL
jgi:hypothetical protein